MRLLIGRPWLAGLPLLVAGCGESCGKDKPYVPYSIDPSAAASHASVTPTPDEPPEADAKVQRFKSVEAQRLKELPKTARSSLGELQAPAGMRIELLLEADLDADSKRDVVAWLRSEDGTRGELVRFASAREGGPIRATTLAPLPADMTASKDCDSEASLQQVGPNSVVTSFARKCRVSAKGASIRWMALVVPTRNPAERLSLMIEEPTGPRELRVEMDGLDRDGDGFDDLWIEISLDESGTSDGSVAAALHYFDRPAGLSRDPHEPSASLSAVAKSIAREAKGKAGLDRVQSKGRRLRRLYAALCAEGGAARVRVGGTALQCGARDAVLLAAEAELDAALRADAWSWAFGVQQRVTELGGNHEVVARTKGRLEAAVQLVDADTYHLPFAPAAPARGTVSWGGLAFDSFGALRIRTKPAPMRFDPRSRVMLPDAPDQPATGWETTVTDPAGTRQLLRVWNPCDGGLLRAGFAPVGASEPDTWLSLPVDAGSKGCDAGGQPASAHVISWDSQALLLMAAGFPVGVSPDLKRAVPGGEPTGSPHEGSGRSHDGKQWVVGTRLGVLVLGGGAQPQLWRSASGGHERLQSCAISSGATAVACVDGKRTRVMVR